jgi:hypothetical protein
MNTSPNLKTKIMKNTFFIGLAVAMASMSSCSKESTDPSNPNNTEPVIVKYEFTSNRPAEYRFAFKKDTTIMDEVLTTQTWSKTVSVARNTASRLARLSVYPPEAWVGTGTQANVNVKLSIDGVIKKDTSGILADFDRAMGITVQTPF